MRVRYDDPRGVRRTPRYRSECLCEQVFPAAFGSLNYIPASAQNLVYGFQEYFWIIGGSAKVARHSILCVMVKRENRSDTALAKDFYQFELVILGN